MFLQRSAVSTAVASAVTAGGAVTTGGTVSSIVTVTLVVPVFPAASVAVALKEEANAIREFPLPSRVIVSAWQAVLRSNIHSTRGNLR